MSVGVREETVPGGPAVNSTAVGVSAAKFGVSSTKLGRQHSRFGGSWHCQTLPPHGKFVPTPPIFGHKAPMSGAHYSERVSLETPPPGYKRPGAEHTRIRMASEQDNARASPERCWSLNC